MSLRKKLTLLFSLLSAITLLLSSISVYMFAKNQLTTQIHQEMRAGAASHVNKLDGWLVSKAKMLEITAATVKSAVGDGEIPVPMLAGYKAADKELSDFYVGMLDGKMIDGSGWTPPSDYDPRTRSWFKDVQAQNKLVFTDPYLDMVTKKMAVSVAMPLTNSTGQLRGVMAEDILLQTLVDYVKTIKMYDESFAYLLDSKGNILAHPDANLVSKNIFEVDKLKAVAPLYKEMLASKDGFQTMKDNNNSLFMVYHKVPTTNWTLVISVTEEVVYKPLTTLKNLLFALACLSVLVVIGITFFIARQITTPLEKLTAELELVAEGNLTVQIKAAGKDEIAALANSFNKMVEKLRGLVTQVHHSAEQMAAASEELTASAHESAQAATQVAGSIADIAQGSGMQLQAVETTASIVEKMSVASEKAVLQAAKVSEKSSQATEKAKNSSLSVDKAVTQMQLIEKTVHASANVVANLGSRSKEIGEIVDTISAIAGQTNLLALNAAIEAARAGEQGRGFAVVAEEVRKLAEQSQEAAKQIAFLISEIQGDTAKAVSAMADGTKEVSLGAQVITASGSAFREIEGLITEVSNQVAEITSTMNHLNGETNHILYSVQTIDELSKKASAEAETVSAATEEQSASMQEIASASHNLATIAQTLQEAVNKFKI